jgi:hypothetical protein
VTTRGVVTATAPLVVNGIRFDASTSAIRIDGTAGHRESELKPGMVVQVKGTKDDAAGSGKASEIETHDAVAGKVEDKNGAVLRVGGQEVEVEQETHFDDSAARLASIAVGDRVKVHGQPTAAGRIRASRVEKDSGTSEDFEVKGFVSDLDAAAGTFTLKVGMDSASSYAVSLAAGVTLPAGMANGSYVEVHSAAAPVGGALVATAIQLEDAKLGEARTEAEVEGLVSSGTSAQFVVAGQTVATSATTRWENGVPADLVPGVKVEAEGTIDAGGILQASKVSFRANIRLQGPVTDVQATTAREGSFRLLGITVRTDAFTEWKSSGGGAVLDLGTIGSGPVEVRGTLSAAGEVFASRVTATNDDRLYVQGPVSSVDAAAGTLVILGVTVAVGGSTEFRAIDDSATTGATFFAAIAANRTVVKVRSRTTLSGTTLLADQAEVEGSR